MAPPKKLTDPEWVGAAYARYAKGEVSLRELAAEPECPVGHQRLSSLFRQIAVDDSVKAAEAKAQARAAAKAADPAKPETMPPGAPPDAVVTPYGSPTIGGWWTAAPEIDGSALYPNAGLVGVKELVEDRRGSIDLTERVRAHPAPDPHRAHR